MAITHPDGKGKANKEPRQMTILYPAPASVKSTRRFGAGILATRPTYRADHTASDEAWWAAESVRTENARFDRQAEESAALSWHEAGLCL